SKVSGDITVKGPVMVNGVAAVSGATVLDGGRVKTGRNASAVVSLGRLGQVELGAESEFVLKLEEGRVGGQLTSGQATVSAPAGVAVAVETSDGVATAEGKTASVLKVDVSCGNTRVAASRSDAKVTAGNRVEYVAAGQEVAVGQAAQGGRCARLTAAAAASGGAASIGAGGLAALLVIGVAGAVGGIVAASQSDTITPNTSPNISNFRP
ncbi:MAG TPA: hypothetical protein VEF04_02165, partial [Blastocatellia bacterium]|nr:hypothetical protein [Blastocatellia bacterium]